MLSCMGPGRACVGGCVLRAFVRVMAFSSYGWWGARLPFLSLVVFTLPSVVLFFSLSLIVSRLCSPFHLVFLECARACAWWSRACVCRVVVAGVVVAGCMCRVVVVGVVIAGVVLAGVCVSCGRRERGR